MVPAVRGGLGVLLTLVTLASAVGRGQTMNPRATAEAAMVKADRDFDRAAADRDLTRFLAFVAENAAFDSVDGRGPEP